MKPAIRLLEKDNNRRGDLFGRLMADLLIALGYSQPRLNIHKSGRELDLSADHRLENRRAVAECKATAIPVGGDDLNKFVGALDAEMKGKIPTIGYFISLAGFRATAVEQEKQRRRTKIVTLDSSQVIKELIHGRIIISRDRAVDIAGRFCEAPASVELEPEPELLAHERGWIWCVYYTVGKLKTHFALIHSDGTPLARAVAASVIGADRLCGGDLHAITCLNPDPIRALVQPDFAAALAAYSSYIDTECGYIHLDGLPADAEVGSRRLRLENLFVPLHLDIPGASEDEFPQRHAAGEVLGRISRVAILAPPGGGKSTLLKRLAVAYVDPARRSQVSDGLPEREWIPLFFRCRELRGLARNSFGDLLKVLSEREPVRQYAAVFRAHVDQALLDGRVLLLIDGLDEISDPGDRAAFVSTLRAALQAYPGIGLIVTSREAGFRHVAAHLAPVCRLATLSSFDNDDIRRLSVAWHQEVVGHNERVQKDATGLAETIAGNDRIRRLAVNPLLLTTLFLVRRWLGSLPTRRAILYGEAVKVLLRTWNIEGHDPIPEEEALPQLCYVASAMLLDGIQKISRPRLAALLQEARDSLPTELGYVKGTVDEFIHRIEDRSSLLMMTGYDVEDSRLVEFFEFRHLTFQEYLTARAIVEGWHPGRNENDTLVAVLEPQFQREDWREVIPLAAVLGGKATELLIQQLTQYLRAGSLDDVSRVFMGLLGDCLADEAAARPETIRAALRQLVRFGGLLRSQRFIVALCRGRYGADFREEAGNTFLRADGDLGNAGDALVQAVWWQTIGTSAEVNYQEAASSFLEMLKDPNILRRCEGASGFGKLGFECVSGEAVGAFADIAEILRSTRPLLLSMLDGSPAESCAALYAIAPLSALPVRRQRRRRVALGNGRVPARRGALWFRDPDLLGRLYHLWRSSSQENIRHLAARAFVAQPLMSRQDVEPQLRRAGLGRDADLKNATMGGGTQQAAALVACWYLSVLPDAELLLLLQEQRRYQSDLYDDTLQSLLREVEHSSRL